MPNQLSSFKKRQSLAEHEAVLAALAVIARRERTSVMELLRKAAREAVRSRTEEDPALARELRSVVGRLAPTAPDRFRSPAKIARFKRAQREFDQTLLDLNLATADAIQERNSVAASSDAIALIDFAEAHAGPSD